MIHLLAYSMWLSYLYGPRWLINNCNCKTCLIVTFDLLVCQLAGMCVLTKYT